ncbi:APC family permease [Shewanella surugensis]|uniref:APC family permease n=1 Tax=Shewanella surugensis TaxID=212020 RepID=A0ABT0LKF3_9GAMM|nr:APC family permease [Shewanella surugensis]MCL1127870.1 APC family permease [Shewanella surugensis]
MIKSREKHQISLFSAVLLCCTCMVGSGWLFSSQLVAQNAGNYAFLSWIVAAVIIIGIGTCLSAVVTQHPHRGATTRMSAISHNAMFGIPFAFANWFGIAVVIATEAQATTQYLAPFLGKGIMHNGSLSITGKAIGVGLLCLYLLINWYGLKLLSRVNNIITVLKIFTPLFVITILLVSHIDISNFTQIDNSSYSSKDIITAIVTSGMIYSFNGFQVIASFASEIKNPKKNIPLTIIISVLIVLAFYLLLQFTFMAAVPKEMLTHGWVGVNMDSPIVGLTMVLGLNFLMLLLLADSVIAPSAVGYTYLGTSSRMLFAMSKEKQAPGFLSRHINPKRGFSVPSMMVNFTIAVIFLLQAQSWAGLMVIVTMLHLIGYMAAPISMSALNPKTKPFGLIIFIIITILMMTVPAHDILLSNIVITTLSVGYMIIHGRKHIKESLMFGSPFLLFLWSVYFSHSMIIASILAVIFFLFVTHSRYVDTCRHYRNKQRQQPHPTEKIAQT